MVHNLHILYCVFGLSIFIIINVAVSLIYSISYRSLSLRNSTPFGVKEGHRSAIDVTLDKFPT